LASEATPQQEPSMEEILASIRRIISEDGVEPEEEGGQPPEEDAPEEAPGEEILELTQVVEEEPAADEPEPEPGLELREVEPEPEPEPEPPFVTPAVEPDRLLSEPTSTMSTRALSDLAFALDEGGRHSGEGSFPLGNGDRTVEDLVRELLRPMLRDWLDANLPDLVQRLVRKSIKEMVRRAEDR